MNFVKKFVAATTLIGALATGGLGAAQAGDTSVETRAFQQDEDLLTPRDRVLSRNPYRYPGWTWMTETHAIRLLKARGFSDVFGIERAGSFWRGKAVRDNATYHVAINRYSELVAHMDRNSRERYAVTEKAIMANRSR